MDSSAQNHAESSGNYLKNLVWDPKRAKLNQNSSLGHVRTYSWLHELRNTQGRKYGTYLRNICGIYKAHMRNIYKNLWYKMIRNTSAEGGAPLGLCFSLFYIINIHGFSSYISYIYIHIYIYIYIPYIFPKYVPYIFPCVFLNSWSQE